MKRSIVLAIAALAVALVPNASAMANPPVRMPTANQPADFAAGDVCPFNLHVEPIADKEVSTLHFDSQGNLRVGVTGSLRAEATNIDTGKSIQVNISGPGKFTFLPNGTIMLEATGNWLLFQRTIDTPSSQLLFNSGHMVLAISPAPGNPNIVLQRTGHSRNLCDALA